MGQALITDAGVATIGAGPVLTTVTAGTGSTFTVRNSSLQNQVLLIDTWSELAHNGYVEITSPKLVPVTNGIRITAPTPLASFLLSGPPFQVLTPQDNLTVSSFGTAADVNLVAIQSYYADLPGVEMQLKNPSDIMGSVDFVFGWPTAITSSGTAGAQNSTVITTTVDSSTANRWYAVLGYTVDTQLGCVGISGIDTSASFIGGPGTTTTKFTGRYFMDLAQRSGLPTVPLWNSANKANTNIVAVDHAASVAANVTLILAQLNGSYAP